MNNINLLIIFVHRRYAVVFLCSLPSQTMRERLRAYLLRHFLAAQCTHQQKTLLNPSTQHSAKIRPNVRHLFGEPAQTFGFGRMA